MHPSYLIYLTEKSDAQVIKKLRAQNTALQEESKIASKRIIELESAVSVWKDDSERLLQSIQKIEQEVGAHAVEACTDIMHVVDGAVLSRIRAVHQAQVHRLQSNVESRFNESMANGLTAAKHLDTIHRLREELSTANSTTSQLRNELQELEGKLDGNLIFFQFVVSHGHSEPFYNAVDMYVEWVHHGSRLENIPTKLMNSGTGPNLFIRLPHGFAIA